MILDLPTDVFFGILDLLFSGYLSKPRLRTFCSLARTCKSIEAILKEYARGPKYGWWKYYRLATVTKPSELTFSERIKHRSDNIVSCKIYRKPRVFNERWAVIGGRKASSWNAIQKKNLDLYSKGLIFDRRMIAADGFEGQGYIRNFSQKVKWWALDLRKHKRLPTPGLIAAQRHLTELIQKVIWPWTICRSIPDYKNPIQSLKHINIATNKLLKKTESYIVMNGMYCETIEYNNKETENIITRMFEKSHFSSHVSGHYYLAACMRYFSKGIDYKKLRGLGIDDVDWVSASSKIIKICLLVPNRTPEIIAFLWRLIASYIHLWGGGLGLIRSLFDKTGILPTWAAKKIKYYAGGADLAKTNVDMVMEASYRLKVATGEKHTISPTYWPKRIAIYTPRTLPKPTFDKKRGGKVSKDKFKKLLKGYKAAVRYLRGDGYRNGDYDRVDWWYLRFYEDHMIG